MRRNLFFFILAAAIPLTGCSALTEAKISVRNRYLSRQAWEDLRETQGCMNFEADFGRGFRAGYFDVANGGDGCPPVLPPQRYWTARYMNTEGRARTEAYFSGYRYGALVAEQDGVGIYFKLPTSLPEETPKETPNAAPANEVVPTETEPAPTQDANPNDPAENKTPDSSGAESDPAPMDAESEGAPMDAEPPMPPMPPMPPAIEPGELPTVPGVPQS